MRGTLYKFTFANGKEYVGITTRSFEERFREHVKTAFGNGRMRRYPLYQAWRKHGEPTAKVLAIIYIEDLHKAEVAAIRTYKTKTPCGYNLTDGGEGTAGMIVSDETRAVLRAAQTGKKASVETRAKMVAALTGRPVSAETRAKIGAANAIRSKGKSPSAETREKLRITSTGQKHVRSLAYREKQSLSHIGKKLTPEHIEKLRQTRIGKKPSEVTREKLRQAHVGKKLTAEHKEKLRQINLGKKLSAEHVEKIRQANIGRKHTDAAREKMRVPHGPSKLKGIPLSDAHKKKIQQARTGKTLSAEHKEKLRQAKLGKKLTPEHKAKVAAALRGRPVSDETRAKLSATHLRRYAMVREPTL